MHRSDLKALDMPVMISEYGFGAADLGRINFWPNILTEADRLQYLATAQRTLRRDRPP